MKRTKLLNWKSLGFGLLGTVVALLIQPNTRSLIIGFGQSLYVDWKLAQIHPQNEREFWSAYDTACRLGSRHYSLFKMNGEKVVHRWSRNADGSMRPWADPQVEELFIRSLKGGAWVEDCSVIFSPGYGAESTWHYRRWKIWLETGLTLAGGLLAGWLGFFLVYFLIIGLVAYVLFWGKVTPTPQPAADHGPQIHQLHGGDGSASHDDTPIAVVPAVTWAVVLALCIVTLLLDRRRTLACILTGTSRAPPFARKRCPMLRLVVALVLVLLPSTVRADAVGFYFGEQLAGQGSAVDLTINRGSVAIVPWIALDGSKFEGLVMARYTDSLNTVAIGPLLGTSNDPKNGAMPYFGIESRGKVGFGSTTLYFRLAERHVKERLLARFANVGLEAGKPQLLVRLSYQPIQRNHIVTHRLAFKATTSYRNAKFGLEVRQNLDGSRHKGALAEVVIPLR